MFLERRENENELQYHKRLIYGKLVDKIYSDIDYSELAEYVYGRPYASDVARRMMYGSKKTIDIFERDKHKCTSDPSIDEKIVELKKERQKLSDQRTALNKIIRESTRHEELLDTLLKAINNGSLPRLDYVPHPTICSDNDIICSLNDIHYGIDIHNYWNTYNGDVCIAMMNRYLDRIIEVSKAHHCENCYVVSAGDLISGIIHLTIQLANNENAIEQVKGVSEIISEFLAELSKHFNTVTFVSVPGNHSRLNTKDNSPKDERLDDLVEWYLKARLQNYSNIHFCTNRIDSTITLFEVRDKTYAVVHGDYDPTPAKIASLRTMVGQPLYCVMLGHLHHNKVDTVQGVKVVMGGSFVGMDDYCIEKRIYGKPEQIICVCNDSGIVCHYDVPLD